MVVIIKFVGGYSSICSHVHSSSLLLISRHATIVTKAIVFAVIQQNVEVIATSYSGEA